MLSVMFSFLEERDRVLLVFGNLSFMSLLMSGFSFLFRLLFRLFFLSLFLLIFTFDIFKKLSAVRNSR